MRARRLACGGRGGTLRSHRLASIAMKSLPDPALRRCALAACSDKPPEPQAEAAARPPVATPFDALKPDEQRAQGRAEGGRQAGRRAAQADRGADRSSDCPPRSIGATHAASRQAHRQRSRQRYQQTSITTALVPAASVSVRTAEAVGIDVRRARLGMAQQLQFRRHSPAAGRPRSAGARPRTAARARWRSG